jgi:uncharacterized protein YjbJ (UPF0337 family)
MAMLAAGFGLAAPLVASHAQTAKTTKHAEGAFAKEAGAAWGKLKGAWTQSKGAFQIHWAKLTDDDMQEIDGRREILVGKIQTRYGVSREEAERQVDDFETSL